MGRGSKTKAQQIQFFEYCLFPIYDERFHIDLQAEVDSTLTTGENWAQIKEDYGITNQRSMDYLNDLEEQAYRHYARKLRDQGLEVDHEDVKELDESDLEPGNLGPETGINTALTASD